MATSTSGEYRELDFTISTKCHLSRQTPAVHSSIITHKFAPKANSRLDLFSNF